MSVDARLTTEGETPASSDAEPPAVKRGVFGLFASTAIVALSVVGFALLVQAEQRPTEGRSTIGDYLTQDPALSVPSRIKYLTPDREIPIDNGGTVALSDDLNLTVTVSPYPPTTFDIDVDLVVTDADGSPVDDATVTAEWDMVFMWHGPFDAEFQHLGDGRYTAPFHFFMVGPWQLVTSVAAPGYQDPDPISLFVYIWPE